MWAFHIWDDSPSGNVKHVADNDLSVEDVNYVLDNPTSHDFSRASGLPCVFGYTPDDRYIIVIYKEIDEDTVRVSTAFVVLEPGF